MLIDTHSHIYSEEFNGEKDEVLKRARENGIEKILLPNIDSSSIKMMLDLSFKYPDTCYPMMGIHPTSVKENYKEELELFDYWLDKEKFCAIGEIGIDLYWDDAFKKEQEHVFRYQLQRAQELDLPVSIHTRDSFDVAMESINEVNKGNLRGVFHCFTGTADQAAEIIKLGFKIGVGGIVTFKNAGIDKMVAELKPEDLILETDAPYLSPAPYRGKRNESSYLIYIQKKVADIFDLPESEVAEITTKNASALFGIM